METRVCTGCNKDKERMLFSPYNWKVKNWCIECFRTHRKRVRIKGHTSSAWKSTSNWLNLNEGKNAQI